VVLVKVPNGRTDLGDNDRRWAIKFSPEEVCMDGGNGSRKDGAAGLDRCMAGGGGGGGGDGCGCG